MNEKKAKKLTDSIFNKLNEQEKVYLAWIHNQKNKEIQELKEENEFLKLSNPEMNIEHSRYVKENKRKIDNLRLVNKKLDNIINELEKDLYKIRELTFNKYNSNEFNNCLSFNDDILPVINRLKELKGVDKK